MVPEERATEAPFGVSSVSRHPVRRGDALTMRRARRDAGACGAMERDPRDATEYGATRCEDKTEPNDTDHILSTHDAYVSAHDTFSS